MSDNTNLDISILERAVAGFDLVLTDTQKQSFLTYYQLLIEWNSFMNLTAITDFEEVCNCSKIRSEEHTSELKSPDNIVCRLLLEKKKQQRKHKKKKHN